MTGYPISLGGDHAEFEVGWAASGRPDNERPDWPLPSFDARDWAAAFCKVANGFGFKDAEGKTIDEGWMITWFANALMRGYDQRVAEGNAEKAIDALPLVTKEEGLKMRTGRPSPSDAKCTCAEPHYLPAWHCAVHGEVVVPMD